MKARLATLAILLCHMAGAQQIADPDFKPHIPAPAYPAGRGPTVAIDEAHGNFHTATGRYKPFADLLASDGYKVVGSSRAFDDLNAEAQAHGGSGTTGSRSTAVANRAQGLAMEFGKGRVVILGEAAMFSAQIMRTTRDGATVEIRAGMNVPGYDNQQLALNVLRWLSGAIK